MSQRLLIAAESTKEESRKIRRVWTSELFAAAFLEYEEKRKLRKTEKTTSILITRREYR